MNRIAIVAVTYNRIDSLTRLLQSLEMAYYGEEEPTLIISVDKSKTNVVEEFSDAYIWPHGEKIVSKHETNLGLRNHMMSLGKWFKEFDTLVVLEDDLVVSPSFYSFTRMASNKYMGSDEVCGISLYSFACNYLKRIPFVPVKNEYDAYFMNCAMSWGEVWMKPQWLDFYEWYLNNQEFSYEPHLPELICKWTKSWLKYHTRYCIETNKYFLHPYVSFSTNFVEKGEHAGQGGGHLFQTSLQLGNKNHFDLPNDSSEAVCYDGFFENKAIYKELGFTENELCIDIYGTKGNRLKRRYWLTTQKKNLPIIKSFSTTYRPIEMGVLKNVRGNDIFLYDTGNKEQQYGMNKNAYLFITSLESAFSIVREYGIKNYIYDALKKIVGK